MVFLFPVISSLLSSAYLSWFYKSNEIGINFFIRIGIGILIGVFLVSFFGGMLGTILSFPFPTAFFTISFLIGNFLGMLIGGIGIPMVLVNLSRRNQE